MMNNSCFRRWRPTVFTAVLMVSTLMSVGCNISDTGLTAYRPPDQYFAVLALEHHAINLSTEAPYDTLTLHTIRTMGDGSVVPGEVTYSVNSPGISVTNGVLKAESAVARAVLRVTLTHGTITRTDSAFVSVIAAAPDRLRDFGLRLSAGDSAKTAVDRSKTIPVVRESEVGSNLSTLLVSLVSSDTMIAAMTQSNNVVTITPRRPGRVVLSTSTFAYGAVWRDSLVFTVGWPIQFDVPLVDRFNTGSVVTGLDFGYRDFTIGVGGCVVWTNWSLTNDGDIQFDDPSHVGAPRGSVCPVNTQMLHPEVGGNIAPFRLISFSPATDEELENFTEEEFENYLNAYMSATFSAYRGRAFSAPGVFSYRSTLHGTTGIVRVCDERNDTTCAPVRIGSWY